MPSVSGDTRPASLHDALTSLEFASRTPAKQRTVKVSIAVDAICHHAFEHGLAQESLQTIVRIVTKKSELDQTSVTNLVKNLYPTQQIPADVVVTIVGGLGQGKIKPSTATQIGLVRWLTTVYEILEDLKIVHRLYGVLFGMLDMISLRTPLCHLLSLITRRSHVKPFRIQQLLELSRGVGNEPALQGLLRIYKDYYPDIILGAASTSRSSFPPRPDSEWTQRLLAIQEESGRQGEGSFDQNNGFKVLRYGAKRSKVYVVPEVHTFHANEASVTLEEIDNVDDFVEKLDRIELPGQLVSSLKDPLLQKYLLLRPSTIAARRVDLWLSAYLEDEYKATKESSGPSMHLSDIFEGILCQIEYTKTILPTVDAFLRAYLLVWDGVTDDDVLLDILSYIRISRFDDVHKTYFAAAESALVLQNPDAYQKLLGLYTKLLRNWTAAATAESDHTTASFPHRKHFEDLVQHVSKLSTSVLSALPQDSMSPTISSILTFFEILSTSSTPRIVPIIIPSPHLIYLLITNASLTTLARTCGILANIKHAFDTHPTPISTVYATQMTNLFNGYLMDTCNLLWRGRALLNTDANSMGCFCATPVRETLNEYLTNIDREYTVPSVFGFSHNALLAALSVAAFRSLEDMEIAKEGYDEERVLRHKAPVTQRSLTVLGKEGGVEIAWKQYRIQVLKWLEERGCGGIKNLMYATMTGLKEAAT